MLTILTMPTTRAMAQDFYAVYNSGTLTFYCDYLIDNRTNEGRIFLTPEVWVRSNIQRVVFDKSVRDYFPTSTAKWFSGCENLQEIEGLPYLNTSFVTDMSKMFYGCSSLTSLDLIGFNTENVTDMSYMFESCSKLTSLDLSSFYTSNVESMNNMFYLCENLTKLDLSRFDISNVTDMHSMFGQCKNLTELDISYWYPEKLADARSMFANCQKLGAIRCRYPWYNFLQQLNQNGMSNGMFTNCPALFQDPVAKPLTIGGVPITTPGQVDLPFITEGTVTYSEDDYMYGYPTLTLEDAKIDVDGEGIVAPDGLVLVLKGDMNYINSTGTGIYASEIFTFELGDLFVDSQFGYGIRMADGGCLSANEESNYSDYNFHNYILVFGRNGAIRGQKRWWNAQQKYVSPSIQAHKMALFLYGDGTTPVIKGLSDITDASTSSEPGKVRYSYDSYCYDKEKQTVITSPSGNVVTKSFQIVPQEILENYGVYIGGEQINNANYDSFSPMSLTQGTVEYIPAGEEIPYPVLTLNYARFDYPYYPTDDAYGLQCWRVPDLSVNVLGDCSLTGTLEDYEYGLNFYADGDVTPTEPDWLIEGLTDEWTERSSLSLKGTIFINCIDYSDYSGNSMAFKNISINDTDAAYLWGEDDIDVYIINSDITLVNDCYPNQPIVEYLKGLWLWNSTLMDGCYWDSNEGCVKDSNGERATRLVRILSDETVGIDNIAAKHAAKPDAVYDMMGRRLGSLSSKPGLYIQNGRKVAVK